MVSWKRNLLSSVVLYITYYVAVISSDPFNVNNNDLNLDGDLVNPFNIDGSHVPIIINTWNYTGPNKKAWASLISGKSAIDSLTEGLSVCEFNPEACDRQVGFGDNPDENGETTLDSMLMDGNKMNTGGVGGIRRVKNAVRVARHVLKNTKHSLIVGEQATEFARQFGFKIESLSSNKSTLDAKQWRYRDHCQPNFYVDVTPNPKKSCGPYKASFRNNFNRYSLGYKEDHQFNGDQFNHDTITMIAINSKGEVAAGSSTNGLHHKIPGRVGDSPLPGAGVYADAKVGAGIGTGDGDTMQRFLPSFLVVEMMRNGISPSQAVHTAVKRISEFYPNFWGGIIAVNKNGTYAAACSGMDKFPFSVTNLILKKTTVFWISCLRV